MCIHLALVKVVVSHLNFLAILAEDQKLGQLRCQAAIRKIVFFVV